MLGDPELKKCKVGDIIQIQRRGFFKVDNAYAPPTVHSGKKSPVILFEIPDGHQKSTSTAPANNAAAKVAIPDGKSTARDLNHLNEKITEKGNLIRDLKGQKAEKSKIDAEVRTLLSLKAEFKSQTGTEWTPNAVVAVKSEPQPQNDDLGEKIAKQGNVVRDLKAQKAEKSKVDAEVKTLLALKAEFKSKNGKEWLPGAITPAVKPIAVATQAQSGDIVEKITKQGDLVRDLKTKKADKSHIDAEVKTLLALKAEYKTQTGQDYKPGARAPKSQIAPTSSNSNKASEVNDHIVKQGNLVRDLKSQKADKAVIDTEVKRLLALKIEYKTITGSDWKPGATPSNVSYLF